MPLTFTSLLCATWMAVFQLQVDKACATGNLFSSIANGLIFVILRTVTPNTKALFQFFQGLRRLLFSAPAGIFQVPIMANGSASGEPELLELNATNPSLVQCDNSRGVIYWAEKQKTKTRIMEASMTELEKTPVVLIHWNHSNIR